MSEDWLEIPDKEIDVQEIMRQIRERIARREGASLPEGAGDPASVAAATREEMIGRPLADSALGKRMPIWQQDCDIVPRYYAIDWRIPILGPIHALVRRLINAEVRRYLFASLEKQSHFNRQVLKVFKDLIQENALLREEIAALRKAQE